MPPHVQRVYDEHKALCILRDKLAEFINENSIFKTLADLERALMYKQLSAMNQYARILEERLSFNGVKE